MLFLDDLLGRRIRGIDGTRILGEKGIEGCSFIFLGKLPDVWAGLVVAVAAVVVIVVGRKGSSDEVGKRWESGGRRRDLRVRFRIYGRKMGKET